MSAPPHKRARMTLARAPLRLHNAVRHYDLHGIKSLVEAGESLTEIDDYGCTPLHLAVDGPEAAVEEMMRILLTADEDERAEALCARADDGLTPLHMVASCSTSKIMDLLLLSVDDEILEDVLEMRSHLKGELFNGNWGKKTADGDLEEIDMEHRTPLHCALARLNPKDDDVDNDDEEDDEPLSDAARAEAVAMIKLLLDRGADVNARDANGRTPVHQAVDAGVQDVVGWLISAGGDPTMGSKAIGMANTTLHQAVLKGDEGMVRALIRAAPHLDVDAAGQNGLTPLCLAARSNKVACAKALVEGGADPRAATQFHGKSAVDIARTNARTNILKLFGEDP